MENSEKTITHTVKQTWSDPEITILSVKDATLGAIPGTTDAAVQS